MSKHSLRNPFSFPFFLDLCTIDFDQTFLILVGFSVLLYRNTMKLDDVQDDIRHSCIHSFMSQSVSEFLSLLLGSEPFSQ